MSRKVYVTDDMGLDSALVNVDDYAPDATLALMWPWFVTALDDWGRAGADPRILKGQLFPLFDHITAGHIDAALAAYAEQGLIQLYEVEGRPYMAVEKEKWFRFQTHIHKEKREKDDSRIPPPPPRDPAHKNGSHAPNRGIARKPAENRASPSTLHLPPTPPPSVPAANAAGAPGKPDARPLRPVPKPTGGHLSAAVKAANVLLHMRCDETQRTEVDKIVPATAEALATWEACLKEWRIRGHKPGLRGPLDWFTEGIPPAKPQRNGTATNGAYVGTGTGKQPPPPKLEMTPEDAARSDAALARLREMKAAAGIGGLKRAG